MINKAEEISMTNDTNQDFQTQYSSTDRIIRHCKRRDKNNIVKEKKNRGNKRGNKR